MRTHGLSALPSCWRQARPLTDPREQQQRKTLACAWTFLRMALVGSARQNRYGGGIEIAGQCFQERDQIGLFRRGETEWLHKVRAARTIDATLVVMLHHLFKAGN